MIQVEMSAEKDERCKEKRSTTGHQRKFGNPYGHSIGAGMVTVVPGQEKEEDGCLTGCTEVGIEGEVSSWQCYKQGINNQEITGE